METAINKASAAFFKAFRPPTKQPVSIWAEKTIRLGEDQSADAGRFKCLPYQKFLLDLPRMTDPDGNPVWKVVVKKAARVGLTAVQDILTLSYISNDPTSVLTVLPRHSDSKLTAIRLEALAESTPALNGLLDYVRNDTNNRSDMCNRRGPGWSLKITGATPASLRSVTARVLIMDEVAAMEISEEGSPVDLAIKRTATYAKSGRLVYMGSTPKSWPDCLISREFENTWQYEWQLKCLHCDEHFTPRWKHMTWSKHETTGEHLPDTARMSCEHCGSLSEDGADKADMVHGGRWHCVSQNGPPGVVGCYINALGSLVADAAWPTLVREFLAKKGDFLEMASFTNLVLGETVEEPFEQIADPTGLMALAEDFSAESVPNECLLVTTGVDVQKDRLECTHMGFQKDGTMVVLEHSVLWGDPLAADKAVWHELDHELKRKFKRQDGKTLKIKAACVDAGDGSRTGVIREFCAPRWSKNIRAIKGVSGFSRAPFELSRSKKSRFAGKLAIVGVDTTKSIVFDGILRLPNKAA